MHYAGVFLGYDLCLNHDCSDKCHAGPEGYVCSCFDNRLLFKDNKTCYGTHCLLFVHPFLLLPNAFIY